MTFLILILFIIGYIAIAIEQKLKVNKAAIAILLAILCWGVLFAYHPHQDPRILAQLNEHLADIAQILFFLIGAMTIVETMNAYQGFGVIKALIRTRNTRVLFWILSFITFFTSSFLDNVTTSIVMISLLHQFMARGRDRLFFASMVIIAANAGGAWSPIGDVTTTMLWIKGYISSGSIMAHLFVPSVLSMIFPLAFFSFRIDKNSLKEMPQDGQDTIAGTQAVFFLGVTALLMVPVLKAAFDLPPYLGILFGLSLLWIYTDRTHHSEEGLRVPHMLKKIDFSSVLFFLGILLAVAALETSGMLSQAAHAMDLVFKNNAVIVFLFGVLSSIVDNVPLTAAAMGMYDLHTFPMNSQLWHMVAYCVGTGGSLLVIGSAAGVIVMGMEEIAFGWYMKQITLPAFIGYATGMGVFLLPGA